MNSQISKGMPMLKGKWKKQKKKKCEVILQKVEMYKEKKNVEKCKKNHQKKRFEERSKSE